MQGCVGMAVSPRHRPYATTSKYVWSGRLQDEGHSTVFCSAAELQLYRRTILLSVFSNSQEELWSGRNFLARCSGGRRPLTAGCLSLQSLVVGLPAIRPVWDSNVGPPASEIRSLTTELSVPPCDLPLLLTYFEL